MQNNIFETLGKALAPSTKVMPLAQYGLIKALWQKRPQ